MCISNFEIMRENIQNPYYSSDFIEILGIFTRFEVLEEAALLTPALIGVRSILKSGGIRAGVKGAGVKKGPAEKGPIRYLRFLPGSDYDHFPQGNNRKTVILSSRTITRDPPAAGPFNAGPNYAVFKNRPNAY